MGGVGARPNAWPEAAAAFSPLAHNPAPNKSAVARIAMSPLKARRIVEPPKLNYPHHRATENTKGIEQSGLWAAYSTSQMGCIMHEKIPEKANATGKFSWQSRCFPQKSCRFDADVGFLVVNVRLFARHFVRLFFVFIHIPGSLVSF
jgi:hypothetical protein